VVVSLYSTNKAFVSTTGFAIRENTITFASSLVQIRKTIRENYENLVQNINTDGFRILPVSLGGPAFPFLEATGPETETENRNRRRKGNRTEKVCQGL